MHPPHIFLQPVYPLFVHIIHQLIQLLKWLLIMECEILVLYTLVVQVEHTGLALLLHMICTTMVQLADSLECIFNQKDQLGLTVQA